MDKREPKNLLPEEEYLKQISALPKVKAPEDFLKKVHERIERRSAFEKIMRALFVPVKIKVPLELAAMAAAAVLIVSTIGIKKPVEQLAYVPKAKMATGAGVIMKNEISIIDETAITEGVGREDEKVFASKGFISADLSSNVAATAPAAENKPVEIALLIERESPSLEKKALRLEEKVSSASKPYLPEALSKVKNLIELAEGKVTAVVNDKDTGMPQYIDAEIPAADYAKFVEKLASIGILQEPILKEAPQGQGIVQVRIKLQ